MRILVDMDDTVAELMRGFDDFLDSAGPIAHAIPRYQDRTEWSFASGRTRAEKRIIDTVWEQPGLFALLDPTPGAKETVDQLLLDGHEIVFVSTPHPLNRQSPMSKYEWVARHFGVWAREATILTYDKTMISGDVLIDDRPVIEGRDTPSWARVIFDRPWNQNVGGVRLTSWDYPAVCAAIATAGVIA